MEQRRHGINIHLPAIVSTQYRQEWFYFCCIRSHRQSTQCDKKERKKKFNQGSFISAAGYFQTEKQADVAACLLSVDKFIVPQQTLWRMSQRDIPQVNPLPRPLNLCWLQSAGVENYSQKFKCYSLTILCLLKIMYYLKNVFLYENSCSVMPNSENISIKRAPNLFGNLSIKTDHGGRKNSWRTFLLINCYLPCK